MRELASERENEVEREGVLRSAEGPLWRPGLLSDHHFSSFSLPPNFGGSPSSEFTYQYHLDHEALGSTLYAGIVFNRLSIQLTKMGFLLKYINWMDEFSTDLDPPGCNYFSPAIYKVTTIRLEVRVKRRKKTQPNSGQQL